MCVYNCNIHIYRCFATQQQVPGFQGCNVIRQIRFQSLAGLQDSTVAGFQDYKVADFGSSKVPVQTSRLLGFSDSKFPGFKVPSIKVPDL